MAVTCKWFKLGQKHIVNGDVTWKASGGSKFTAANVEDALAELEARIAALE